MTFDTEIKIEGVAYTLVDVQRDGITAIYKAGGVFVRVGDAAKIKRNLALHKSMIAAGFPIAAVQSEGVHEDAYYFIEESMGERNYAEIFRDDIRTHGAITADTLAGYLDLCERFARAQLTTKIPDTRWAEFREGIKLDWLINELPELTDALETRFTKLQQSFAPYPFVLSHGDLTPFNVFPKGVIDIEDSFYAPVGYDLADVTEHLNWVPTDPSYEFSQWYHYTDEQRSTLLSMFDRVLTESGIPPLTVALTDFDFAKGVWFAVRMHHTPKIQVFRYAHIRETL